MESWLVILIGSQVIGLSLKATVSVPLAPAFAFRIQVPERVAAETAAPALSAVRLVIPAVRRMSLTSLRWRSHPSARSSPSFLWLLSLLAAEKGAVTPCAISGPTGGRQLVLPTPPWLLLLGRGQLLLGLLLGLLGAADQAAGQCAGRFAFPVH